MNRDKAFLLFVILFAFASLRLFIMLVTQTSVSKAPRVSASASSQAAAPEEQACRETHEIAITAPDQTSRLFKVGPRPPVCVRITAPQSATETSELVAVDVWVIQTVPSPSWLLAGFPLEEARTNATLPRQYVGGFKAEYLPQTFTLQSMPGDPLQVLVTAVPIFRSASPPRQATISSAP